MSARAASWSPRTDSRRRAKQLSSAREDGAGGDVSSGAPLEADDEVRFLGRGRCVLAGRRP